MRPTNNKNILNACKMAFDGKTNDEIAALLGVNVSVVTRYRKTQLWKDFEKELIDTYKQSLLGAQSATLSEG